MKKNIITHAIAFILGSGIVFGFLLWSLWYVQENPELVLDRIFPETESVEAIVKLKTTQELDPSEFIGLESSEIVAKFPSLKESQREGLIKIFESGIRTEVEFTRDTEDESFSYSFHVQDGKATGPTIETGVSVEIMSGSESITVTHPPE